MPSSHLILCHPLFLLPPIPPSIRVFSNESALHMRWSKYWSSALASFLPKKSQGSSPSEWAGWISLQSKGLSRVSPNITVQKHQFFFTVQLSHLYMTTGKTIALTRRTFVGKVMSLLFNMLSRLVVAFLPRGKRLLICCCCSVTQLCPAICDSMDCSTPCCPVLHHLLELAQTHVH